jgi:hypothetical protein
LFAVVDRCSPGTYLLLGERCAGIASRKLGPRLSPVVDRFTVVTGTPFRLSPVLTSPLRLGLRLYDEAYGEGEPLLVEGDAVVLSLPEEAALRPADAVLAALAAEAACACCVGVVSTAWRLELLRTDPLSFSSATGVTKVAVWGLWRYGDTLLASVEPATMSRVEFVRLSGAGAGAADDAGGAPSVRLSGRNPFWRWNW